MNKLCCGSLNSSQVTIALPAAEAMTQASESERKLDEVPPEKEILNDQFPAHSAAMSCIKDQPSTSNGRVDDRDSITVMKSDESLNEVPLNVEKRKRQSATTKRKGDKSKDKRKTKFWGTWGKGLKKRHSQNPTSPPSSEELTSKFEAAKVSDHVVVYSKNDSQADVDKGPEATDNDITLASSSPNGAILAIEERTEVSNSTSIPIIGAMAQMSMGAGPSSNARHWLLAQVVPAPANVNQLPPPRPLDLRQIVPPPRRAIPHEDDLRREMARANVDEQINEIMRDRLRAHVAYPHIQYPSTSGRNSISGSSSSPSDSLWSLSNSSFQHPSPCSSTSVPHYPGADSPNNSLSTFGPREELPPPSASACLPPAPPSGCIPRTEYTQVDYIHFLVPDLKEISNCGFYWGVMDRYEAERLLENKPEGTFLLRDSAQEEFLFSVSFRRYGRSLHARIDQWNHKFSFDTHDPGVFSASSVTGLIEHYKDPSCCMFFEPMLTIPLNRNFPFSLQHLCRAAICKKSSYDGINYLPLPKTLCEYLKYYHYKLKVRVRRMECPPPPMS